MNSSIEVVSIVISFLSLAISGLIAWLTLLRQGRLRMTRPTLLFFGFDEPDIPKIVLRMLLFSTARRGHIAENMFVKVKHAGSAQAFTYWGYAKEGLKLDRGGGLYVPYEGVTAYHHFPIGYQNSMGYQFLPGEYSIEVFASLVNRRKPLRLIKLDVSLNEEYSKTLNEKGSIMFDWSPESQVYVVSTRENPKLMKS